MGQSLLHPEGVRRGVCVCGEGGVKRSRRFSHSALAVCQCPWSIDLSPSSSPLHFTGRHRLLKRTTPPGPSVPALKTLWYWLLCWWPAPFWPHTHTYTHSHPRLSPPRVGRGVLDWERSTLNSFDKLELVLGLVERGSWRRGLGGGGCGESSGAKNVKQE